jgi:hypothetical protein
MKAFVGYKIKVRADEKNIDSKAHILEEKGFYLFKIEESEESKEGEEDKHNIITYVVPTYVIVKGNDIESLEIEVMNKLELGYGYELYGFPNISDGVYSQCLIIKKENYEGVVDWKRIYTKIKAQLECFNKIKVIE